MKDDPPFMLIEPGPFWEGWTRLEKEYDRRLPPDRTICCHAEVHHWNEDFLIAGRFDERLQAASRGLIRDCLASGDSADYAAMFTATFL
jgi:hypothetical protein